MADASDAAPWLALDLAQPLLVTAVSTQGVVGLASKRMVPDAHASSETVAVVTLETADDGLHAKDSLTVDPNFNAMCRSQVLKVDGKNDDAWVSAYKLEYQLPPDPLSSSTKEAEDCEEGTWHVYDNGRPDSCFNGNIRGLSSRK